tara:strand:- start:36 stop:338 length:303 start_codon:yes stop_codon:yes gene_type:complete
MTQTLLIFMSFLNFMFYPLVIATIIAVIIEQVIRRFADSDPQSADDSRDIRISMGIRKYLYRQAWIVNLLWLLGYVILMFTMGRQAPQAMPDMIWQGGIA